MALLEEVMYGYYSPQAMVQLQREATEAQRDLVRLKQLELSQNREARELVTLLEHYATVLTSIPHPAIASEAYLRVIVNLALRAVQMSADLSLVQAFSPNAFAAIPRPVRIPTTQEQEMFAKWAVEISSLHSQMQVIASDAGAADAMQPNDFDYLPFNVQDAIRKTANGEY